MQAPHHTNKGIEENKAFSINIPDVSLVEKTDYCGPKPFIFLPVGENPL